MTKSNDPLQHYNSSLSTGDCSRSEERARTQVLPSDFRPSSWTVLCGRGRESYEAAGNGRLKVPVDTRLDQCQQASSKMQKSIIVTSLVDAIREAAGEHAFVKKDPTSKQWVEVSEDAAREKVGQLMREALVKKDPEKAKARKDRRRQRNQEARVQRQGMDQTDHLPQERLLSAAPAFEPLSLSRQESDFAGIRDDNFTEMIMNPGNQCDAEKCEESKKP